MIKFSLRKFLFAFAVFYTACGTLFSQTFDFISEHHDNYIGLTMTGCEEKYVNGFVGWYRGKSVSVIPFYFEDSDWSFKEMAGPYNPPDSNSL